MTPGTTDFDLYFSCCVVVGTQDSLSVRDRGAGPSLGRPVSPRPRPTPKKPDVSDPREITYGVRSMTPPKQVGPDFCVGRREIGPLGEERDFGLSAHVRGSGGCRQAHPGIGGPFEEPGVHD